MSRPKYTKQDANQLTIEQQLLELGFKTMRTSNGSTDSLSEVHPLDLFVLGLHRKMNVSVWSQWEIKTSESASVTEGEIKWMATAKFLFGRDVPVQFAYSVDDILSWYGWT